jgi:hypothetical protein
METPRNVVQDVPNLLYQDTRARAELNKVLDLTGLRRSVGLPGLEPVTSSLSEKRSNRLHSRIRNEQPNSYTTIATIPPLRLP